MSADSVLSYLRLIFGRRHRVPRDQSKRPNAAARKLAQDAAHELSQTINALADLPNFADIAQTRAVPAGFYRQVQEIWTAYDAYAQRIREAMSWTQLHQAGQGEQGIQGCYAAPMGVSPAESFAIAKDIAAHPNAATLAKSLHERANMVLEDIQSQQSKPNSEKADPYALQKGRHRYHARGLPCPLLDEGNQRCIVFDKRPISCRMHHLGDPAKRARGTDPDHANAQIVNIRLPAKAQVAMTQHVDKRMGQISPLLFAGVLQALELGQGQSVREVGQARQKVGRDGRLVARANRNVSGSKKNQKNKQKQKRRPTKR